MARKDELWNIINGTYIKTIKPLGYDILINGTDKYLNFNSLSGSSGYGFRDNGGTMEFKDSGGSWAAFSTGGGSASFATLTGSPYDNTNLTTALNTKADKTFAIAMALALG